MGQVSDPNLHGNRIAADRDGVIVDRDHLHEAASAIEQVLAYAHEDGQEETVRVLLAVVAILRAAPRH